MNFDEARKAAAGRRVKIGGNTDPMLEMAAERLLEILTSDLDDYWYIVENGHVRPEGN